ncbi:acetolactate synthase AlsS [Pectinatus sottacetonis]|uniref:acetolactate synthase AlsS n=1 Tax=Pectinatus sottacetonis TaxID=1002795 RepID=UPI0018C6731A|nr:acetolactate synthase AlsS [Pectinatus sottacetonis]
MKPLTLELQKKKANKINILTGAELVVDSLEKQGVKYIFGIPGAKIDKVFDVLQDHGPELIVCRHEQNAAFMAAMVGRLTCKPGVCLVTSGPGATNLATGIATANVENDPIVAIVGNVSRDDKLKKTHQALDNVAVFRPITKFSAEVIDANTIPEVMTNAFRSAQSSKQGAAVVSFPQDVLSDTVSVKPLNPLSNTELGTASISSIEKAVDSLKHAKMPVILAGIRASRFSVVNAVRTLLRKCSIPVVETFQASGLISRDLEKNFLGRVGLFRNQPGDHVLEKADVLLTIGYDPVEYDPKFWNQDSNRTIIHLDESSPDIDNCYQPDIELIGNIESTINELEKRLDNLSASPENIIFLDDMRKQLSSNDTLIKLRHDNLVHPLEFIHTLRRMITDNTTVTCDVGSHYIWMARHFRTYEPKTLLFSNGMQTLGVALPWAMAASLVNNRAKTISISGDGGFLFSAMELETAVRLKLPIVHFVWRDGSYNMVAFQQMMKYNRTSGVDFGAIDIVKYAEAFGAKGLRVDSPDKLKYIISEALAYKDGPVVVDIPIDYSDNIELGQKMLPNQLN